MKKICLLLLLFTLIFLPVKSEDAFPHHENVKSIKVYIPTKHEYTSLMKKAFNEWESASKGKVKFLYVSSPRQAQDIVVFNDMFSGSELGMTTAKQMAICISPQVKRVNGETQEYCPPNSLSYINVTIITIAAKNPYSYEKMNNQDIYLVMLHEIGHSLGLNHTNNPNDLMYPTKEKRGAKGITQNDIKALYDVYGWKYR